LLLAEGDIVIETATVSIIS